MSVYEISPNTGTDIQHIEKASTNIETCRRLCNDTDGCSAFTWYKQDCRLLPGTIEISRTYYKPESLLYIKQGNPSYWLLWIFLAGLIIIIFTSWCGMSR
jgi:hypothetical protein